MRVYALLLGIALTTGYGYATGAALSSVRGRPVAAVQPTDVLYYGGTLDPITVEAKGDVTVTARCQPPAQPRYRAISSEKVRTSIGLVM